MKIYIAGPMRGHVGFNFPAFFEAASSLRICSHEVVNPADWDMQRGFNPYSTLEDQPHMSEPFDYAQTMKEDLRALLNCDAIYMLKGWKKSEGASLEHQVALTCGLEILGAKE